MTGLVMDTSSGVLTSLVGAGGLAALTIRSERPDSPDSSV